MEQLYFSWFTPHADFSIRFAWGLVGFKDQTIGLSKRILFVMKTGRAENDHKHNAGWVRSSDVARALGIDVGTNSYTKINETIKKLVVKGIIDKQPLHKLYRLSEKAETSYDKCKELWDLNRVF